MDEHLAMGFLILAFGAVGLTTYLIHDSNMQAKQELSCITVGGTVVKTHKSDWFCAKVQPIEHGGK